MYNRDDVCELAIAGVMLLVMLAFVARADAPREVAHVPVRAVPPGTMSVNPFAQERP